MSRTVKLLLVGAVVVVIGLVIFVACSASDDEPAGPGGTAPPEGTVSPSAGPEEQDLGVTVEELSAALFDAQEDVLASVDGEIPHRTEPIPGTVEITDVYAGPTSTVLRFTLIAKDDSHPAIPLEAFNQSRTITGDIRDVSLIDEGAQVRLQSFVGGNSFPWDSYCACSTNPRGVTTAGLPLTATFPPVEGGDMVTVEIRGFPPLENIPVRRD